MSETFFIGMDLGTSRTTICTSTGKRMTTRTVVGYVKDIIGEKRFGAKMLIGEEAFKHRISLDMIQPLEDGVIKTDPLALQATKLIMEYIVHKALPERKKTDKVLMAIGTPAKASLKNKKDIIKLCHGIANKVMLVSEPFAVAYALDRLDECIIVDCGAGSIDLMRMHGTFPEEKDQMTLTTAGNFLDAKITKGILAEHPKVQLTPEIVRKIKEKYGYVSDTSDKIIVTLTVAGIPKQYNITEVLHKSCLKFTDPICEAVQKMVAEFDPEFQKLLRDNIIVAGGGSRLRAIDRCIEKSLEKYGGGDCTVVMDAEFCGAEGAIKLAMEMPEDSWEKV